MNSLLHKLQRFWKKGDRGPGRRILIVGLPKSGTSILFYRVAKGLKNKREYFEPKGIDSLQAVDYHLDICRKAKSNNKNLVTKSLFYPGRDNQLLKIAEAYDKKIWIVRDPRDLILSTFFYTWYKEHKPDPEKFEKALELVRKKEKMGDAFPMYKVLQLSYQPRHFVQKFEQLADTLDALPDDWFILKYEDFIQHRVQALNDYLGYEINTEASVASKFKRVSRTNAFGNWRRWFNEEDVAFFRPLFNPALERLGYDAEDWELTEMDQLPAEEGSAYMKKVFS